MNLTLLDKVLWAAGLLGHVALFLVLMVRRRFRSFPVFTALVGFELLTTVVLYLSFRFGTRHGYFLAYWVTAFGDYFFQVALIFEIARHVLRPTGTWVRDARRSFLTWGGLGLLVAAGISLRMGAPEARGLDLWDARITVFTCLLTCELLLAMSVAANRLGLRRGTHVVDLGEGLAVWAAFALMGDFGHIALGWNRQFAWLDRLSMLAYLGVVGFWTVAFWLPERERAPLSPEMRDYLIALHRSVQYDVDRLTR